MADRVNRRSVLTGMGTLSLAGLLSACTDDDGAGPDDANGPTGADEAGEAGEAGETTGTTSTRNTGAAGSATDDLFADSATCALTPEQIEGPFYVDVDTVRGDLRDDREGVLLNLALRVRDADTCEPLPDAVVDLWHCDAFGDYSAFDGSGGAETTYLRGAQVTDADGVVRFVTVYPGWYPGRTPHIHAKGHLDRSTRLTTQLYFDDDITDIVYARPPYDQRGAANTSNEDDGIFDERLVLTLRADGDGYLGVMTFDVEAL
jgi:protocatechuate 3,4-dioxygenase beta subunit